MAGDADDSGHRSADAGAAAVSSGRRVRGWLVAALALVALLVVGWLVVPRSPDRHPSAPPATSSPSSPSSTAAPRPRTISRTVLSALGWSGVQEPHAGSITAIPQSRAPGRPRGLNPGPVLRVELRPGETTETSGYVAPRAELYGRTPAGTWSGTPPSAWPDPPGAVRWFDFSVFVPRGFPTASHTSWLLITQWKGLYGGTPPVSLQIRERRFYLGGKYIARPLGDIRFGGWTRFTVGVRFSPDRTGGWVELYRDGGLVVPRTSIQTMGRSQGRPDPSYLKQGIYRSATWRSTQVLYFGAVKVSATRPTGPLGS